MAFTVCSVTFLTACDFGTVYALLHKQRHMYMSIYVGCILQCIFIVNMCLFVKWQHQRRKQSTLACKKVNRTFICTKITLIIVYHTVHVE